MVASLALALLVPFAIGPLPLLFLWGKQLGPISTRVQDRRGLLDLLAPLDLLALLDLLGLVGLFVLGKSDLGTIPAVLALSTAAALVGLALSMAALIVLLVLLLAARLKLVRLREMFLGLVSTSVTECGPASPSEPVALVLELLVLAAVELFRLCFTRHLVVSTVLLTSTSVLLGILALCEHLEVSSDRYFLNGRQFLCIREW